MRPTREGRAAATRVRLKLSPIADDLAKRLHTGWNRHCIWEHLRDEVDLMTGQEHSTWVLDKLTDMVKTRLPNR